MSTWFSFRFAKKEHSEGGSTRPGATGINLEVGRTVPVSRVPPLRDDSARTNSRAGTARATSESTISREEHSEGGSTRPGAIVRRDQSHPRHKSRLPSETIYSFVRGLCTAAVAALAFCSAAAVTLSAQVELTQTTVCNVTTNRFDVVWRTSAVSTPGIDLFSDAAGTVSLAGQARVEFSPLGLGDVEAASTYEGRVARRALQTLMSGQRLVLARVSGLPTNATVYFRPRTYGSGGADNGTGLLPLTAVNLAAQTGFVADAEIFAVNFSGAHATGMVAVLSGPTDTVPLASVVGDGEDPDVALFNLADILSLALDTNAAFGAPVQFTVRLVGVDAPATTLTHTVTFQTNTIVAGYSSRPFGGDVTGPAYFVFDAVSPQNAGLGFTVTVRAMQSNGQPLTTYTGTATLAGSGPVAAGAGESSAFTAGVLSNYPLRIDQPGAYSLTASHAGSTGTSNIFTVSSTYGSWSAINFTPAQLADPTQSGPAADLGDQGVPNLLRYGFSTGLTNPNRAKLPTLGKVAVSGSNYLTLTFERLAYAAGLSYRVEGSSDLQTWSLVQAVAPGTPTLMTVQDTVALGSVPKRFLRVSIVQDPTFANFLNLNASASDRSNPSIEDGSADPGNRGVTVLERYAYDLNYANPSLTGLPAVQTVAVGGQNYLSITFNRLSEGGQARYLVQTSTDQSTWTTLQTILPGAPRSVTVQDTVPVGSTPRYIRVAVQLMLGP